MNQFTRSWGTTAWTLLWICGILQVSEAADIGGVQIHGFGGWAYGVTDNENRYLIGSKDGNYDAVNFSMNLSANPSDQFSVYVQTGFNEQFSESEVGIDYAFAEWYVNDAVSIRAGKVKAPFLLYTEIYDVGTLRPFFNLPAGIYQQFTAEAYKGVGLTGTIYSSSQWDVRYDVYGGELELLPQTSFEMLPEPHLMEETPILKNMIGGRILLQTPIDGLIISGSGYGGAGDLYSDGQPAGGNFDISYLFLGASAEYLSERFWVRAEYAGQQTGDAYKFHAFYLEPAYKLTEHVQAALRYEWLNGEADWLEDFPESFLDHQDMAFGLNVWLNPGMVVKVAYHLAQGNRCAQPSTVNDFLQVVQRGKFEENTHVFSAGIQFSF